MRLTSSSVSVGKEYLHQRQTTQYSRLLCKNGGLYIFYANLNINPVTSLIARFHVLFFQIVTKLNKFESLLKSIGGKYLSLADFTVSCALIFQ